METVALSMTKKGSQPTSAMDKSEQSPRNVASGAEPAQSTATQAAAFLVPSPSSSNDNNNTTGARHPLPTSAPKRVHTSASASASAAVPSTTGTATLPTPTLTPSPTRRAQDVGVAQSAEVIDAAQILAGMRYGTTTLTPSPTRRAEDMEAAQIVDMRYGTRWTPGNAVESAWAPLHMGQGRGTPALAPAATPPAAAAAAATANNTTGSPQPAKKRKTAKERSKAEFERALKAYKGPLRSEGPCYGCRMAADMRAAGKGRSTYQKMFPECRVEAQGTPCARCRSLRQQCTDEAPPPRKRGKKGRMPQGRRSEVVSRGPGC
ncbi:hypothetical protein P8C59_006959 [Phyllachora maydis]|uniref:Uncharacterized protein n=1 Tax=Phyllachora maydis TaxID=1825666 RepID=A0AAD9MDQ7_9PEZI|nr:hypothetical protein P8C59_006959 [Phyllachora maydis]